MSKTPRGSSTSSTPQRNAWRDHTVALAEHLRERDLEIRNGNAHTVITPFGTWRELPGGCSTTDRTDPQPVPITSKRKHRRA